MRPTEYIIRVDGEKGRGSTPERARDNLPEQARAKIPDDNPVFGDGDSKLNITRVYRA